MQYISQYDEPSRVDDGFLIDSLSTIMYEEIGLSRHAYLTFNNVTNI